MVLSFIENYNNVKMANGIHIVHFFTPQSVQLLKEEHPLKAENLQLQPFLRMSLLAFLAFSRNKSTLFEDYVRCKLYNGNGGKETTAVEL